jgi:hypothetical protein
MDDVPSVPILLSCAPSPSLFVNNSVVLFNDWISVLFHRHLSLTFPS